MTELKRLHVAVCITRLEPGGQSTVIEEQTRRLAKEFEFTLFTEKLSKNCPPWMKCIEMKPWFNKYMPIANNNLINMLRKFDVIHCHDSVPFIDMALKSGRPVIVTSHGFPPVKLWPTFRGKVHAILSRIVYPRYYRRATKIIAISKYIKHWLIHDLGVPRDKITLLYNGIDLELFKPFPKSVWEKYRLGDPMILYVGYIGKVKRTHVAVQAIKEIIREFPKAVLALVGHHDESYRRYLMKLIEKLNLKENIKFIGFVPKQELPLFYNAADVLVVTSPWEGFGLPIVEALACGTPVIARKAFAMREHIEESGAGTLYSDDRELAKAILEILCRGKKYYSYKAINYAKIFDYKVLVKKLLNLYHEVIQGDNNA